MTHLSECRFLQKIKTVIFDCDGVLWLMEQLIDGALDLVEYLKSNNIRVYFVTNNSGKTGPEYKEKFNRLGFKNISEDSIIGAARIAAVCLKKLGHKNVFVVGSKAIDKELEKVGILTTRHLEETARERLTLKGKDMFDMKLSDDVDGVLCGMDYDINYLKICMAASYVVSRNLKVYATNPDAALPNPSGLIYPGAGAIKGAIEGVIDREVDCVFGKPNKYGSELIDDFDGETSMMVGDRIGEIFKNKESILS